MFKVGTIIRVNDTGPHEICGSFGTIKSIVNNSIYQYRVEFNANLYWCLMESELEFVEYGLVEEARDMIPDKPIPKREERYESAGRQLLDGKEVTFPANEAETSEAERFRSALLDIRNAHVPDQPASSQADEVSWVMQHVGRIRKIAADALDKSRGQS